MTVFYLNGRSFQCALVLAACAFVGVTQNMVRRLSSGLFLALAACTAWPEVPDSENATASDWPVLLPFEDVGQPSADINREQATTDVLTRADNLRIRAALLRQPVSDDEAMERLRQSLVR